MSNIHNASRRWRLRTYLIVLVVLFMAASAGSVGYEQVRAVHNAQQAATSDARFAARLAAHDITTALDTLSRTLADVTANPDIGQAFTPDIDPATCPLTFAGVGGFQTGHIDIIRQDGSVTCSSLKEGRTRTYRGESWLARAFTAPGVTGPVVDARTGKRVVLGTAPVPGHGVVAGFLNLDSLGPGLASVYGGPRGLTFLITSADRNIILTRSTDPARWVGAQVRDTPFRADPQHAEQPDPDGVVRLYGSALVPGLGWYVFAGANREEALAAAHALSSQQAALSIAALLVILAAAWGFHRRIVQPIRRLNASVREGVTGNRPRPVPVEGPAELAELAEDFNEMIDATQRHLTDVSRLAAIVRSSTDAIIGKTLEGIITSWNNGAEEVYGYTSEEIVGRPVTVLVPPDRHDEVDTILERVSRGERVERLETRRVRKDGTEFDASVSISPILAPNGTIVGASAVTRDISELKRAAEERASLEQRLQQSQRLESLGQLAGGVAHDFNNLLAVIMSYTEFLEEEVPADSPAGADVRAVKGAAERAARLTRQLLIFGRQETVTPEVLNLDAVVADVQNLLARSIGEHVELVVRAGPQVPAVRIDRGQLEQVLMNLAVNARDAMPDGGTLTIETAAAELDEAYAQLHPETPAGVYAQLSVSDTGTGMPPEVIARVFEPFFTTKPKGAGTGLGLATVYGIIAEAGGSVSIYSEDGLGTTFRIYLPRIAEAVTAAAVADVARPEGGRGEMILLVEDEEALRQVTARMLRRNGYEVIEAANGVEALEVSTGTSCDLLLTDVVMPQMSGRELAERLRETRPDLPVLFMSGYSQGVLGPRRALNEGVALLEKPFSEAALLTKLRLVLRGVAH